MRARASLVDTAFLLITGLSLAAILAGCCGGAGQGAGAGPAGAAAPGQAGAPSDDPSAAPRPRLVVLIVIDQLPSWSFERDRELFTGGLARLLRQGLYVPRADLPYAVTSTAPGHAALGTGAPPSVTRVVGNSWWDPGAGRLVTSVADPDHPVLFVGQGAPAASVAERLARGASSARLVVDGVADVLRRETGGRGKSVAISIKDRAAILVLGRRPDLAVWYDSEQLAMTTSRFYADQVPGWLGELGRAHPVSARLEEVWQPLAGVDHAAVTGIEDAAAGEDGPHGLPAQFPYRAADATSPGKAVAAMPLGHELIREAALAVIDAEGLGRDEVADVLALSFSAHDYAGHSWGQESWERLDIALRLDRDLGVFLDALDQRVGRDRYAVVLTSDHGVTRMVERSQAAGRRARRVKPADIARAASDAAARILGPGSWVAHCSYAELHVTAAFRQQSEGKREAALEAMAGAIEALEGMGYAARVSRIAGECGRRSGLDARACRSVVPGRSGEIFFAAAPDSLISSYEHGTNHGSPNPDDSTVPIIVYAPGWPAATSSQPASLLQVAPTVAKLLGIAPPPAATAPALAPR